MKSQEVSTKMIKRERKDSGINPPRAFKVRPSMNRVKVLYIRSIHLPYRNISSFHSITCFEDCALTKIWIIEDCKNKDICIGRKDVQISKLVSCRNI